MDPRETEDNVYAKFLERPTNSTMVCYGIFWSGELIVSHAWVIGKLIHILTRLAS